MLQHIMCKHHNLFIIRRNYFALIFTFAVMKPENIDLTYRIAVIEDAPMVAQLAAETFCESWTEDGNEADVNQYVSENFTVEHIVEELTDPNITYLLALSGKEAVAYVKLERNVQPDNHDLEKPLSIRRVYVRKPSRERSWVLYYWSNLLKWPGRSILKPYGSEYGMRTTMRCVYMSGLALSNLAFTSL